MFSPEELEQRRNGVGASDVPAILGVDQYKTPLRIYSEKLGLVEPDPDSEAAEAGRVLEEPIAQWCARRTGATITPSPTLQHPTHAWAYATPDRDSVRPDREKPGILEVKNRNEYVKDDFGEEDSDELPKPIVAQVTWQMMVRGVEWADVAVLIGGNKLRIYTVYRDAELESLVFTKVERFWLDNVKKATPPAPVAIDNEGMKKLFPENKKPLKAGAADLLVVVQELQDIKQQQKTLEEERDEREAILKLGIGDGEGLTWDGGYQATWKNNKASEVVDWKELANTLALKAAGGNTEKATSLLIDATASHTRLKPGARVLRITEPKKKEG